MTTNTIAAGLDIERRRIWESAKGLLDHASTMQRDLTAEEEAEYRRMSGRLDEIDARLDELREQEGRSKASEAAFASLLSRPVVQGRSGSHMTAEDRELDRRIRDSVLNRNYAPIDAALGERRSGYQPAVEMRAALATSGNVGTTFGSKLMAHLVENTSVLAAGATVMAHTTGEPFKYPRSTADSTAAIVAEGAQIAESAPTLSSVTFGSYKYGHMIYITRELAEDVSFDLIGHLAFESGRAIGGAFGTHSVTGTGSSQPTGVVTGATLGITSGTGVSGAFTADNLIDLYHSLASPYARSAGAGWLMSNASLAACRKLKDSQNRYLFDVNVPVGSGASGMLLGRPVYVSSAVANTGNNNKSVLFGDFGRYVVRTVGGVRFDRSDDFKFDTDTVSFRATARLDGALVDASAVKYFAGAAT